MAVTLLQLVQRVNRKVGLDPTITSFSNDDESNDVVQDIVEAYEDLVMALPPECPYLNASGSISAVDGTRLYALASDAQSPDLYEWSFENETENDAPLTFVTKDYVQALDPRYDEVEGKPKYIYLEGSNQVGIYPIPDASYTIKYQYGKSITTRLSATTDTFILPDRWMRYPELMARAEYEGRKGMSDSEKTMQKAIDMLAEIMSEAWEASPTYLLTEDF